MEIKKIPGEIQIFTVILIVILLAGFFGITIWLFMISIRTESIEFDSVKKKR